MNAKEIKSHIWITYQGADKKTWVKPYKNLDGSSCRRGLDGFPILNTTEINLEIQGEDLELVDVPNSKWTDRPGYRFDEWDKSLRYTPKQTPKADSEKREWGTSKAGLVGAICSTIIDTPLSKVDNHIGETVEDARKRLAKDLVSRLGNSQHFSYHDFDRAFNIGVNWRTQHPHPAMVDRILEYVSHNISDIFMKADTLAGQKRVVKSMQDDILKELSK